MVVTLLPATVETCVVQDRVGWPLMWTVQAPHRAMPQPNLVPVIPRVSRRTHNRGICGTTSTVCDFPFRVNLTAATGPPLDTSLSIQRADECGKALSKSTPSEVGCGSVAEPVPEGLEPAKKFHCQPNRDGERHECGHERPSRLAPIACNHHRNRDQPEQHSPENPPASRLQIVT